MLSYVPHALQHSKLSLSILWAASCEVANNLSLQDTAWRMVSMNTGHVEWIKLQIQYGLFRITLLMRCSQGGRKSPSATFLVKRDASMMLMSLRQSDIHKTHTLYTKTGSELPHEWWSTFFLFLIPVHKRPSDNCAIPIRMNQYFKAYPGVTSAETESEFSPHLPTWVRADTLLWILLLLTHRSDSGKPMCLIGCLKHTQLLINSIQTYSKCKKAHRDGRFLKWIQTR